MERSADIPSVRAPLRKDWKENALLFYTQGFAGLNPQDAARRCKVPFDRAASCFEVSFMGTDYRLRHPDALSFSSGGTELPTSEKILVLRYLCEGRWQPPHSETRLSYRQIPWGEVYYRNFEGRCIKRFAGIFGEKPQVFENLMEQTAPLHAQKIVCDHTAYRFMFFSNLYLSFHLWTGDDEFPAQAQILFDDNIPAAFSAEDIAVACEAVINNLKRRLTT